MSSKKEEALAHIKEAEKHLKTGFLKWKPDLDSAADEYNKAATCYKTVRAHAECRDVLAKAANAYQQNGQLFAAAKCYEQGVLMSKELGDLATVVSLGDRAATLYQQHGSPESASGVLEKAAKIVETAKPEQAVPIYERAADVAMLEDRHRAAAGYAGKAARLLVRLHRHEDAVAAVRREMGYQQAEEDAGQMNRLTVVLVLLQLAMDDVVAARKAFDEWSSWCEAEEVATLITLLQGYDEEDPELAQRALNSSFIKHMDVDFARLAKSLKLPEATEMVNPTAATADTLPTDFQQSVTVSQGAGAEAADGQDADEDSDDEYAGGLL